MFRKFSMRFSVVLVLMLFGIQVLNAAQKRSVVRQIPMPMTAPLYLESPEYSSTLYLVNSLKMGVQADVMLSDMSGLLLTTKHLYLEPNSQRAARVAQLQSETGVFSPVGSIQVVSPDHGSAILGQLSITRSGERRAYLDEELFMPEPSASHTLQAVIDAPANSPVLAVTNTSTTAAQNVTILCQTSSGSRVSQSQSLQPMQTRLLRACNDPGNSVIRTPEQAEAQFLLNPGQAEGMQGQNAAAISITGDGPAGDIAAFGFVEHNDSFGRYFSAANFIDPALQKSSEVVFAGVPVGASRLFPSDNYVPQLALANFSDSPISATLLYTTQRQGNPVTKQVGAYMLPAKSNQLAVLPELSGDPDWQNAFVVHFNAKPGAFAAKMMFKSKGILPNVELIGKDGHDPHSAGDHPWSLENGTSSTLLLFNHSTETRTVNLRIGTGGPAWLKDYELAPGEVRAFPLASMVEAQTADGSGQKLSSSLQKGEISWWAPSEGASEVSGRLVQVNAQAAMARNFSCGYSVGLCSVVPSLDPIVLTLSDGQTYTSPLSAMAQFCSWGVNTPPGGCQDSGDYTSATAAMNYSWASENTSIAMIASGANASQSNWQAVAEGSTLADITASLRRYPQNSCTGTGGVQATLPQPDHIVVLSDTTSTLNCPGGSTQLSRGINYSVQTSDQQQVTRLIKVYETVDSSTTSSCTNSVVATTSTCTQIQNGYIEDKLNAGCPGYSNPGCGYTFPNQSWQACLSSGSKNLGTIGQDIVLNNSINLGGNITSYSKGKTFPH